MNSLITGVSVTNYAKQNRDFIHESRSYDGKVWNDINVKREKVDNEIIAPVRKFPSVKSLPIKSIQMSSPRSKTPPGLSRMSEDIHSKSPKSKLPRTKIPLFGRVDIKSPRVKAIEKFCPSKTLRKRIYVINMIYNLNYSMIIKSLETMCLQRYPVGVEEKKDFVSTPDGEKIVKIVEHIPADDSCLTFLAAYMGSIPVLRCLRRFKISFALKTPTHIYRPAYYAAKGGHIDTLKWLLNLGEKINIFTIDAADMNSHPHLVEWLLLEGSLLRKDSLLYSQYYLEYGVREDRLNIIKEIHTHWGQWGSAQLYTEITEKTSRDVVEYLWDHEAPMLSIYFTPPPRLRKRNLEQIINWWCSQRSIKNGVIFESYFRPNGKNRDLLNRKCRNDKDLKEQILKRMFFSNLSGFGCSLCSKNISTTK